MKSICISIGLILCTLFSAKNACAQISIPKDTTVTVKVSGITCGGDLPLIIDRVNKEVGVKGCKAVSKAGAITKFEITYNPAIISYPLLLKSIEDAPSCDVPEEKPYRVKKTK